tara:strand:+ start:30596 stop:31132 length:537 start_codon:yes stop_codon:yes gene_type:complete
MTIPAVNRLSEGQKDCLRLVLGHLNSKEIARELGVSPHTVDQRLRTAMRILNVQSRFIAAREFAAMDREHIYQPLIYQSPKVEPRMEIGKLDSSSEMTDSEGASSIEDITSSDGWDAVMAFEQSRNKYRGLPVPRYRGEKNTFGSFERLGWILTIAIGSALSFGGLIAGLEALSRLTG